MKIYLLQENYHGGSNHVIFASESLEKVTDIVREKYKMDDEDIKNFLEWKEFYNLFEDIKIFVEEIELNKLVNY